MITKYEKFNDTNEEPTEITKIIDDIFLQNEYIPNLGLLCLESYWDLGLGDDLSMQPFLNSLGRMVDKKIQVFHKRIDGTAALKLYTQYPDGLLFNNSFPADNIQVIYLGLHGLPGRLATFTDDILSKDLIASFRNYNMGADKLVYFGACRVFEGETGHDFAYRFLQETGVHAVCGYSAKVSWVDGLLTDMLFLSRFFDDPKPFEHIQEIYESVLCDFLPADKSGFVLFSKMTAAKHQ